MTAKERILAKSLVTSGLSAAEADRVRAGLKDRAFFSARCESVRHLQAAQKQVADWLGSERRADGALASRASAVSAIMASARKEGLAAGDGTVADPGSAARAKVIVDTNAGLARGYVARAQQSSLGARLAFPAQELIRAEERREKRDWRGRWQAAGGRLYGGRMIALKEDPVWVRLSRFGVPYPPFDFGSGMGVDEVDRDTCLALGVFSEEYMPEGDIVEDFNATLEAELEFKGADDPGWRFLKDSFGDQVKYQAGKIRWQADIIRDALKKPASIHFGSSAHPASAKLNLTMPKDMFTHELKRHIGAAEKEPANVPLTEKEAELIPHVWRHPERVKRDVDTGASYYEMEAADGGTYRLIVDIFPAEARMRTFYKMKGARAS